MKIALFGHGKMGKLVEQLATQQGHEIISIKSKTHSLHNFEQSDVCIDFSHSSCVIDHLKLCILAKKPVIIGTTGWEANLPTARDLVSTSEIGCLYAPNLSLGVHFFMQIVSQAARLLGPFEEYDITGIEYHHKQKKDRPSGTAKHLIQLISKEMPSRKATEFTSIRCGTIPGKHTIHFEGHGDSIVLTHEAHNREGFAKGAIQAAEWIIGKQGFFTLDHFIEEKYSSF